MGSFSGIIRTRNSMKEPVTLRKIKSSLNRIHSYGMHKEVKKTKTRNPYFIYKKRQQIQMDLIEIREYSNENEGINYLLTAIDMFSKYLFCSGMKTKTASDTIDALDKMLDFYNEPPEEILSDRGSEFKNKNVRQFFESRDIRHTFFKL